MSFDWRPWRQLLPAWVPAVVLGLASLGFFFYQTSDSMGRRASLTGDLEQLESEVERLTALQQVVEADRREVEELQERFRHLNDEVFGDLDLRLTRILRAVGSATREAGLLPGTYSYSAKDEKRLGYVRFGIGFQVTGEYAQIRSMLAALQASPEFLIVDALSLAKDEDPASRALKIGVRISTSSMPSAAKTSKTSSRPNSAASRPRCSGLIFGRTCKRDAGNRGDGDERFVDGGVGGQRIVAPSLPEAAPVAAHVPVRQPVDHEVAHRAAGAGRVVLVEAIRHLADQRVQLGQQPAIDPRPRLGPPFSDRYPPVG